MEPELRLRARRVYERARLWRALPWALPALGVGAIAWLVNGRIEILPLTVLLAIVLVGAIWRGQDLARGVGLGFMVGILTAIYPLIAACGQGCSDGCAVGCTTTTAVVGGVSGLFLLTSRSVYSAVSALMIGSLIAAMGCLTAGAGGLIGVGLVLAVGTMAAASAPVLRPG